MLSRLVNWIQDGEFIFMSEGGLGMLAPDEIEKFNLVMCCTNISPTYNGLQFPIYKLYCVAMCIYTCTY